MKDFLSALTSAQFRLTALRVAMVVGSILFVVNHGSAVLGRKMTRDRWTAALLTYIVPYTVSIHGQLTAHNRNKGCRDLSSATHPTSEAVLNHSIPLSNHSGSTSSSRQIPPIS